MEINAIVAKIDEIQKSIEKTGATDLKVDALAKQFADFQALKTAQERAQAKHKMFGTQASYDRVANAVCKALVNAGVVEAERSAEWLERANANVLERAANLNQTDSGKGPTFIPTSLDTEVSKLVEANGILRRYARVRPNVHGNVSINKRGTRVTVGGISRPDASITTGGTTYSAQTLSTTEVGVITTVEEKLIWDSPIDAVQEAISDIAEAAAEFEDDMLWIGDGTSAYCGFTGLKSADTGVGGNDQSVSAATGLTVDDCLNLRTLVHTSVFGNGKFFMHPYVFAGLQTKKASTSGVYFFDISSGTFKLGGSDIVFSPRIDSTVANTKAPVVYGDLSKAVLVGTGRPYEVRVLTERYADLGQVGIRVTYDLGAILQQATAVAKVLCTA